MIIPEGFEKIGEVCVDSGQLMIIDPCYMDDWKHGEYFDSPDEEVSSEDFNNYHEACAATCSEEGYGPVLDGLGIAFSSGWGDGAYSVYALKKHNRIVSVLVVMEEEEDEWM